MASRSLWDRITERLVTLGLSRSDSLAIVRQVKAWFDASGPEWTVSRLKNLKIAYIRRLNGEEYKPEWIAWRGDAPKGAFRPLFKRLDPKGAMIALNALSLGYSFVSSSPTRQQLKKFHSSVTNPPLFHEEKWNGPLMRVAVMGLRKKVRKHLPPPFPAWPIHLSPNPRKRMSVYGLSYAQRSGNSALDSTLYYYMWDEVLRLRVTRPGGTSSGSILNVFPDVWEGLEELASSHIPEDAFFGVGYHSRKAFWGRVSFLQEPGFKLRAVAVPNLAIQAASIPFQQVLRKVLSLMERDCTFDQQRGVDTVRDWLSAGQTVHSLDLSDATNVFPAVLTEEILSILLPSWRQHLDYFMAASRGDWYLPKNELVKDPTIKWVKGQPLGLAPSFFAFAISHHIVAEMAWLNAGRRGDFRILGDDIVIVGDRLAEEYRKLLSILGCPISETKSVSGKVAEFAGRIISPEWTVSTGKWRSPTDENFVEVARQLGPKSLPIFRPRQRKVLSIIGPIPEFLGGCGWNPHGLPLAERIKGFDFLFKLEEAEFTVTRESWGSDRLANSVFVPQREQPLPEVGMPLVRAKPKFDPRPEDKEKAPFPGYEVITGVMRPLTEMIQEFESLPGYRPVIAVSDHRELDLIRWEKLLRASGHLKTSRQG